MPDSSAFDQPTLDLLDRTIEVDVETRKPDGSLRRTIIWVMVVDGVVFIRSYRGPNAHWFREIQADPKAALIVGEQRIPVRAIAAVDSASIEACSHGLWAKYPKDESTSAMVREEILPTTLRLEPI